MKFLRRININITAIIKNNKSVKEKIILFFLYFKATSKYLLGKTLPFRFHKESFLGLKVDFFTYQDFRSLLSEIFIFGEYDFENIFTDDVFTEEDHQLLIIDGGSNIGMSILYLKKKYPKAKVIAFEPDKKTFQMLKENVQQNDLSDVEFHQLALSDETGETDFYIEEVKSGSLGMSLNNRFKAKNKKYKKETVKTARLSDYAKKSIDLLKLDVEGAESSVIRELAKSNRINQIKRFIIEYHYDEQSKENRLEEILSILRENNFEVKVISTKDQLLEKNNLQHNSMIYARKR